MAKMVEVLEFELTSFRNWICLLTRGVLSSANCLAVDVWVVLVDTSHHVCGTEIDQGGQDSKIMLDHGFDRIRLNGDTDTRP